MLRSRIAEETVLQNVRAEDVVDTLKQMLRELSIRSPILGAAIFSVEGLPLVSHFHRGTEEVTVAAMVAGMFSAGEQTVRELRQGDLKSIIVQGDLGTTVVVVIPDQYILIVTAPENAKLGLVFSDAKRLARDASRLLRGAV